MVMGIIKGFLIFSLLVAQSIFAATIPEKTAHHASVGTYTMGASTAPITIVMYYSLTCHHCKNFRDQELPKIKKDFIDTGKVKWVLKDFPTDHAALKAAQVAWCQGEKGYMALSQALLDHQEEWAFSEKWEDELKSAVKKAGVKAEDVDAALKDEFVENAILQDALEAQKRKITYAPAFIIHSPHHPKEGEIFAGDMTSESIKKIVMEAEK